MTFPWWLFALYLAKGADYGSTEFMLKQPNFYEANILATHHEVRVVGFVAAPILVEWGARSLEKKGHPKQAVWLRISMIALWSVAAGWNLSQ